MNEVKLTGTLVYDPQRVGFKKTHKMRTLIAMVRPGDMAEYYEKLIQKVYGPWAVLHRPMYGYHVTVVSGKEKVTDMSVWKKYEGEQVELSYDIESLQKNWSFWNFRVRCDRFKDIRSELKMNPDYHFHLTIGRDDTNIISCDRLGHRDMRCTDMRIIYSDRNPVSLQVKISEALAKIPKIGGNQELVKELKFLKRFPKLNNEDATQIVKRHIPNPIETEKEWEKKVFELFGEIK